MAWLPISGASVMRFSTRIALAILIPGAIVLWLLVSATAAEERLHTRNLRWLGQMAGRIQERVRYYDGVVRSAAERGEAQYTMVGDLKPIKVTADCSGWQHLSVHDEGQGPQVRFREPKGPTFECAEADLGQIVGQALRAGAFDSVVLARRRDGRVLYQAGGRTLNITDIRFLFAPSSQKGIAALMGESAGTKTPAPSKDGGGGVDLPSATLHLRQSIGDREYGVFVQPLPMVMASGTAQPDGDWLLIGLSERNSIWATATPRDLMIVFPFAVLLVILSWPLPRLWYMRPADPLRRLDLAQIAVCTLGVALVLSFLGLYYHTRQLDQGQTDATLNVLAESIGRDLRYDLETALLQLVEMNTLAQFTSDEEFQDERFATLPPEKIHTRFDFVDWINAQGDKTIRWTPKKVPTAASAHTQLVNVKDRPYFRDTLSGPPLSLWVGGAEVHFAVEQVLSRTTGQFTTMLAIPSGKGEDLPVASIGVRLASVNDAVSPKDYGFAVIDPSGKVLFHSESSRIFVENLFEECDDAGELPAIAQRRVRAALNVNYSGVPHRLLVTPVPHFYELPWTLVVYRSLTPSRLYRMQALVDSVALFGAYAAVTALVLWVLLVLVAGAGRSGQRRYCSVPRGLLDLAWWSRRQAAYPYAALAGFAVLAVFWRALERMDGPALFYAAIAGSVTFLGVSAAAIRRPAAARSLRPAWSRVSGPPVVLGLLSLAIGDWAMAAVTVVGLASATLLLSRLLNHSAERPVALNRAAWVIWGIEFVLALCVLPVFFTGKLAAGFEADLSARATGWNLWNAEAARRRTVFREIRSLPGVDACAAKRLRLLAQAGLDRDRGACPPLGFYGLAAFHTVIWPAGPRTGAASPGSAEGACGRQPPASRRCAAGLKAEAPGPTACAAPPDPPVWVRALESLPRLILAGVELPSQESEIGFNARERGLEPAGALWDWHRDGQRLTLCSSGRPAARSDVPSLSLFGIGGSPDGSATEAMAALTLGAGLAGMIVLLAWWLDTLRSRVLLLGLSEKRPHKFYDEAADADQPRLLLLAPPGRPRGMLPEIVASFCRIDLAREELPADTRELRNLPAGGLLIDHLEARFSDELARRARLEMLEAALLDADRPVIVVSTLDPVRFLETGGAGAGGSAADGTEITRWLRVLSHLEKRCLAPRGKPASNGVAEVWDSCSEQEKLLLTNLVRHRLLNPNAAPVIAGLAGRGLLKRRPSRRLDFFSTGFREFVREAQPVAAPNEAAEKGKMRNLPAYAIALVLFGVVLFVSQEELTTRLIGFLTTVTGGFEAIRRQLGGSSGGGESKGK